jgi:hypothetical protein
MLLMLCGRIEYIVFEGGTGPGERLSNVQGTF